MLTLREPNPDWSAYYASGSEIQAYFRRTVAKYNLDRDVKCGHRVEQAVFDADRGQWDLKVKPPFYRSTFTLLSRHRQVRHKDTVLSDSCDVLISATGFLSHWRWPSIPGLHSFKGHLAHSAAWDRGYDYSKKRIGVIGNGSSAIQIVPQLIENAAHLTNFVRHPTWITPGLGSDVIDGKINYVYSEEEKRVFREDPEALKAYRKKIQRGSNVAFAMVSVTIL